MGAWPGGPCPKCGEEMPPNQVHCRLCRALLNPELEPGVAEIPAFIPLPEIDSMAEIYPNGVYLTCPQCHKELKVNRKYFNERVACKHCRADFQLDPSMPFITHADSYSTCPHCEQELRFAHKYVGQHVACRFCNGKLEIMPVTKERGPTAAG